MGTTPNPKPAVARLKEVRDGLLALHKILLDCEREHYDHEVAKITSTGQMLQLVMNDPYFAWLRELSALIVEIDERVWAKKQDPPGQEDLERFIGLARTLLVPDEHGKDFEQRYDAAMQRDPDIVIAHGRMMKLLAAAEKQDLDSPRMDTDSHG